MNSRLHRPAVQPYLDPWPSTLFGLLRAVVMRLAQALKRTCPEPHRVSAVRLDVIADRRGRGPRWAAHAAKWLSGKLRAPEPLPTRCLVPPIMGRLCVSSSWHRLTICARARPMQIGAAFGLRGKSSFPTFVARAHCAFAPRPINSPQAASAADPVFGCNPFASSSAKRKVGISTRPNTEDSGN